MQHSKYMYKFIRRVVVVVGGVWGVILTRILQNIQEGISVTFTIQLHCPVLWLECSVPFSSGQLIPSTGQVVMSLCSNGEEKKIPQVGRCSSLHGYACRHVCSAGCVRLVWRTRGHPPTKMVPTWSWRSQKRHRCTPGPPCSRTRTAPGEEKGTQKQ